MTIKEIENKLLQLEQNILALAERTSNRNNVSELNLGNVKAKADEMTNVMDDMALTQADLLLDVCMLELGIENEFEEELE